MDSGHLTADFEEISGGFGIVLYLILCKTAQYHWKPEINLLTVQIAIFQYTLISSSDPCFQPRNDILQGQNLTDLRFQSKMIFSNFAYNQCSVEQYHEQRRGTNNHGH